MGRKVSVNRYLYYLIFILIISGTALNAQSQSDSTTYCDSLKVSVTNIAINGELTLRGLKAAFPSPILATISVAYRNGDLVFGLADTTRWLEPTDTADIGLPISTIWKSLLEYHRENPLIPDDPNLYHQLPPPRFTEVRQTTSLPTSTMLVMDLSASMKEGLEDVKAGARLYVEQMRSIDRAGIVQFDSKIIKLVKITDDKELLLRTIDESQTGSATAVYDAMMVAVQETKLESGRRGIIVYTDGRDNRSKVTPEAVIDSARTYNLPFFNIALGNNTSEDTLKQIASQTGGLFFKAATAEEMQAIYGELSSLIQNYYVMAFTSPDPQFNGTWRMVDVSLNVNKRPGRATGHYFVPAAPPSSLSDLSVAITSVTDTTLIVADDTLRAVRLGETFEYQLIVENFGPVDAQNIQLKCYLPDSVFFINATVPPIEKTGSLIQWHLDSLSVYEKTTVGMTVQLASRIPTEISTLISRAEINAPNDTLLHNNVAEDTVYVLFPEMKTFGDLVLTQSVLTDTTIVIGDDSVAAVLQGGIYEYRLMLKNLGPATVTNIQLWDIYPDSVSLFGFNQLPATQTTDTLFWWLDSLMSGNSLIVSFKARVSEALPLSPFPLINTAGVIAENDTIVTNNLTTTLVYAFKPPEKKYTDVAITMRSITDTVAVINQASMNVVQPGELYVYELEMVNKGIHPALNVRLQQLLPDSVRYIEATLNPTLADNDSLSWNFPQLDAHAMINISIVVRLSETVSRELTELTSTVHVVADNDTLLQNNSDVDTVRILHPEWSDLVITQTVTTDTSIILEDVPVLAVVAGDTCRYQLLVRNLGPSTSRRITLWDIYPDSVVLSGFNIKPSAQMNDTLFWHFDSLWAGDSIAVHFQARVADALPFTPFPLTNTAAVISINDTLLTNNFARTTIYAIPKPEIKPQLTDLTVTVTSITDTFAVVKGDTFHAVTPGTIYDYQIELQNLGYADATGIRLIQWIPDSISIISATTHPEAMMGDSIQWNFDRLASREHLQIFVSVRLADKIPEDLMELISEVKLIADNDTLLANNTARDTVRVLFPAPLPIPKYDLSFTQIAITDTMIVIDNDTVQAVRQGDVYQYQLTLENNGPATAKNFMLWDVPPDSVTFINFTIPPAKKIADTLFWHLDSLSAGNRINLSFQAIVADSLPYSPFPLINIGQVNAQNDTLLENNRISTQVYGIFRPKQPAPEFCDVAVMQSVQTDSIAIEGQDTLRFVRSGETFKYTIEVANLSDVFARSVVVVNCLSDSIVPSAIQPTSAVVTADSIIWNLGELQPRTSLQLTFAATISNKMPIGKNLIINRIRVQALNENPDMLSNNTSQNAVFNVVRPRDEILPLIEAMPPVVDIGEDITVRVQVLIPIRSWDIWIYLADGTIDSTFADEFIVFNLPLPNEWVTIPIRYSNTRLLTSAKVEQIKFELRTIDVFDDFEIGRATVLVRSNNALDLDRNVFIPNRDNTLAIRFKLSSNRIARLDLYDIAGSHVTKLSEAPYQAGWNTFHWNGITETGQSIGSSLYIVTIRSDDYTDWKKVMIVR